MSDEAGRTEARPRYRIGDELPITLVRQGSVLVNRAVVVRDYGDCVLAHVDLFSKRAVLDCAIGGDEYGPSLCLSADDGTRCVDESKPRTAETVVEFAGLRGWLVFGAARPARYTVSVTLLAPSGECDDERT